METRANYVTIGAFTLLAIAAAFGFVLWFSGADKGYGRQSVRIVFTGSVSGLSTGSSVSFNGIRVGEVREMRLLPEDPRKVTALVDVDRATQIRTDTRARLEYQGLTGIATIALVGGEPSAAVLVAQQGQDLPTIFADRSDFGDLMESARNIAKRADEVLASVGKLVSDNEAAVSKSLKNVEEFTTALNANSPALSSFMTKMGAAADRIGPLSEKLEVLAEDATKLIQSVDREKVANVVSNVENVTQTLSENREAVGQAMRDLATLTERLNESSVKLDGALVDAGNLIRSIEITRFNNAVANVEGFSETLSQNRGNVDQILKDGASLISRLDRSSIKLDAALTDVSNLAKAVDAGQINRAVANIEGFTGTLNANREQVASIISDVSALTKAIDAERVNRAVANAEKFTQALANASGDTEAALKDARSLVAKLNTSADKVDGVLLAAQNFLGVAAGPEGSSTFGEIREAARSMRILADNLDRRTAEITAGVNRFTGPGAREYEALATEGRKTVNDIGRAVRSLERNPSQVIFGGRPSIPEYNGRR